MKKILVLGGTGMAGHMITLYLKTLAEKYIVYNLCHSFKLDDNSIILDINNLADLNKLIESLCPDVVINTIGILNKTTENNPSQTIFINSYFPRYLEQQFKTTPIKLIHLSTDCVFSGETGRYSEASITDGKDLYGRTKILGEINNSKDLTVRTSIIGPELKYNGTGLFHWFMQQDHMVNGYSKVIWSGVTTLQLAKGLHHMIKSNLTGLYNLTSKASINKYELLKLINRVFNKNLLVNPCDEVISDRSLLTIRDNFLINIPTYEEMLTELKDWMTSNKNFYSQYFYDEEIICLKEQKS